MAIERQHYERNLRKALEHQKVLVSEINHRVKNSLQLVASFFSLQATAAEDAKLAQNLQEAIARVTAVARIHERLYRSPEVGTVDLTAYIRDICGDLAALAPQCEIVYQADGALSMTTDRAVRVALLATELITNATKHAGPGRVFVNLNATPGSSSVRLMLRDEGRGLPDNFNIGSVRSLGMRIIRALVDQMGATLTVNSACPGAEFVADVPFDTE